MKVASSTLRLLNRWEIFQFLADVLRVAERNADEMPQSYREKLSQLRTSFDIYDIEIAQNRRPSATRLLEVEEERNEAIRAIYNVLRAYVDYKYSEEKKTASKKLLKIFRFFGSGRKISRSDQETKTAMITNLLQELSAEAAQQHIVTLGLTDVVTALETNNLIFEKEQRVRFQFKGNYVTGVAKNARADAQKEFLEFVTLINSLAVVEGEEKYTKLKQFINVLVKDYVATMRQRTNKKEESDK